MNIWILNHYATSMYFDGAGRHHSLAKYLIRMGHKVRIFCSDYGHNGGENVELNGNMYVDKVGEDSVQYTFVKTVPYTGNGSGRIKNMISFYRNIQKTCNDKIKHEIKPDIILASSVHPLTLVAGIQIAKKIQAPCVCEIRDIWPLTLVAFKKIKENSLLHKTLLKLELWTYKKADKVIFTMEGGKKYIKDMGWDKYVPDTKIGYINNGVDLEIFKKNIQENIYIDDELSLSNRCFTYAGTIGEANKVEQILNVAEKCKSSGLKDIKFLIFGDGSQKEKIENIALRKGLDNIIFKGFVDKKYIPSIVSRSYANLIFIEQIELYKYGMSLNKSFDYLAAGKPILLDYNFGYNYILDNHCGIMEDDIYDGIINLLHMDTLQYDSICNNAIRMAEKFSFDKLSQDLIEILKEILNNSRCNL